MELFFRWLKCVLGCKQLLTTSENGVALQIYTALIASLLIVLWTGRKPTKRTWEMLQFYFQGWASLEEVRAHLEKQKLYSGPQKVDHSGYLHLLRLFPSQPP